MNEDNTFLSNPFVVDNPEKLDPEDIVSIFVEEYTHIETVKQRKHTIIWGSRGSGKSMLLKYLEPQCQAIKYGSMESFLALRDSFIGVYCQCKEGQFNKFEFEALNKIDKLALPIIAEHNLTMLVGDRFISLIKEQLSKTILPATTDYTSFAKEVVKLFDTMTVSDSIKQVKKHVSINSEPLKFLQDLFNLETSKIYSYLEELVFSNSRKKPVYRGTTSNYHNFLLPFLKTAKKFFNINQPFYLLIDDAGRITKTHQSILNTWIANRDQRVICIKLSAERNDYKTFYTRDKVLIEKPHDYSQIEVEELYTKSKKDYLNKVKLIANRRLKLSGCPTSSIEDFLPTSASENDILKQIKITLAQEFDAGQGSGQDKSDFVSRYAIPRLFQFLKSRKQKKSYAGFENMVHLSSGVVRDFLEPCYLMVDKCVSRGEKIEHLSLISTGLQNDILYDYSEDFLTKNMDDLQRNASPDELGRINALRTLLISLGLLYYERLHDPAVKEPRVFSFTVKSHLPNDLKQILDFGVTNRYFQLGSYGSKDGGGHEHWYILNRRLCPAFKLDPTGFEGRISLTIEDLKLACENSEAFIKKRLKSMRKQELTIPIDLGLEND